MDPERWSVKRCHTHPRLLLIACACLLLIDAVECWVVPSTPKTAVRVHPLRRRFQRKQQRAGAAAAIELVSSLSRCVFGKACVFGETQDAVLFRG